MFDTEPRLPHVRKELIADGSIKINDGELHDSLTREYMIERGHLKPGNGEYSNEKAAAWLLSTLVTSNGLIKFHDPRAREFYRMQAILAGKIKPRFQS